MDLIAAHGSNMAQSGLCRSYGAGRLNWLLAINMPPLTGLRWFTGSC